MSDIHMADMTSLTGIIILVKVDSTTYPSTGQNSWFFWYSGLNIGQCKYQVTNTGLQQQALQRFYQWQRSKHYQQGDWPTQFGQPLWNFHSTGPKKEIFFTTYKLKRNTKVDSYILLVQQSKQGLATLT